MKTIIIIAIICALLYAHGISEPKPEQKPTRNRSEENKATLRLFLREVDDWQQDCPELKEELTNLYATIETAAKYGCTAKEYTDIIGSMKHYYKLTNKS